MKTSTEKTPLQLKSMIFCPTFLKKKGDFLNGRADGLMEVFCLNQRCMWFDHPLPLASSRWGCSTQPGGLSEGFV